MKTLYLECSMGAAGDMLTAALYELLPSAQQTRFLEIMNHLLPDVKVIPRRSRTCGIVGTCMDVTIHDEEEHSVDACSDSEQAAGHEHAPHSNHDHHDHHHHHADHHHHTAPTDIAAILKTLHVPQAVKADAAAVYQRIAEAESKAHGMPVDQIHFHEVGALDAVADIVGVCLIIHLLRPEHIMASPVHLGSGQVHCAHGVVPVPAPATAFLLEGIPCYTGDIRGELCTPTGAALLAHFAGEFGPMPVMTLEKTGYGVGKKEFSAANCVRAFWGETGEPQQEEIVELCCHIDDMTAEALAFTGEELLKLGALDIAAAPLTMKKGRAGVSYTVLCKPGDEVRIAHAILRETNSNGVRSRRCRRYMLTPSIRTVETAYGPIRIKCADGEGIHREKPEYEDVAAAARNSGAPFCQVWESALVVTKGKCTE